MPDSNTPTPDADNEQALPPAAQELLELANKLYEANKYKGALPHFQKFLERFDTTNPSLARKRAIAQAFFRKAFCTGMTGDEGEEAEEYGVLIGRYKDDEDEEVLLQVAKAYFNKGVTLGQLGRPEEGLKAYHELINKFGSSRNYAIQEQVAMAYVNKGVTLGQLKRPEEELEAYDELINKFGKSKVPAVQEIVAKAYFNKGVTLGQLGRPEEELIAYDALIEKFGSSEESDIQVQVAMAYFFKGITLGQLGRPEEELQAYDALIEKFGKSKVPAVQEQVAKAYLNKGIKYRQLGNTKEAITTYNSAIRKFRTSKDSAVQKQVASTYLCKGYALIKQSKHRRARLMFEAVIKKFENLYFTESKQEHVEQAYLYKGITLALMSNNHAVRDEERKFSESMVEPTLQDKMSSVPEFIWIKNQIDKIKKVIEQGDDPEDSISLPELTASLIRLLFKSKAALEVIELIEEKEVEPEPNNYYHYTSIHALRSILPVSKEKQDEGRNYLRVASLEGVNDPEEGTALREYCKSRKNFESEDECGFICGDCLYRFLEHGIDDEISMHMFMLCFSDSGDRLDLWRMYAKDGEGFSIGIPKREFGGSMVHGFDFTEETIAPAEFSKEALLPDQLPLPKSTSKKSESKNKPINLCKPVRVHYKDDAKGAAAKMVCRAISEIMDKYEKLKEMEWKREALKNHDSRTREFSINETKKNSASRNYLFAAQGVMLELLYRFKYEDYESEREYRIFSFQPEISTSEIDENLAKEGKAAPVFFPSEAKLFKNPDYEIYIGPRVKLPGTFKLELEHRLSKQPGNWSKNVTIHNSKTHYR